MKIGYNTFPKRKGFSKKRRKYKWKPWKKNKTFSKKKKYIRKKKPTSVSKKKTCKCYICNQEGHYAPKCSKKEKSAKKMIKVFEEQDFEIIYGEEISDEEEILYEFLVTKKVQMKN